jgi:hypothetical protein
MLIPKTLNIAGKVVSIDQYHKEATAHGLNGKCFYEQCRILLDTIESGQPKQIFEESLIHETIHFCNGILGVDDTEMNSERYVSSLSELMYQVIKQIINAQCI